jgi:N-acyl homoserine lactone hydrolase
MRVHVIQTGRVRVKRSQIVGRGRGLRRRLAPLFDAEWSDWLPVNAYAMEHREGVILVDTGSSAGLKRLPRWHPYFRFCVRFDIEPEEEAGPQLQGLGIGSADVKRVVLTHLHLDHDGGLGHFPASKILVSPAELRRATGAAGQLRGYLPQRSEAPRSRRRPLRAVSAIEAPDSRRRDRRRRHARPHAKPLVGHRRGRR